MTGLLTKVPLVVSVPGDGVTGQVFNPTTGFVVDRRCRPTAARRSSCSTPRAAMSPGGARGCHLRRPPTQAQPAAHVDGAVFKGLAMATTQSGRTVPLRRRLPQHTILVFDANFEPVDLSGASSTGPARRLRAVQHRGSSAASCTSPTPSRTGQGRRRPRPGQRFVDVYDPAGDSLRACQPGALNSPWGMAFAPDELRHLGGPSRRQLRRRAHQRLQRDDRHVLGTLRNRNGTPSRSTASGR